MKISDLKWAEVGFFPIKRTELLLHRARSETPAVQGAAVQGLLLSVNQSAEMASKIARNFFHTSLLLLFSTVVTELVLFVCFFLSPSFSFPRHLNFEVFQKPPLPFSPNWALLYSALLPSPFFPRSLPCCSAEHTWHKLQAHHHALPEEEWGLMLDTSEIFLAASELNILQLWLCLRALSRDFSFHTSFTPAAIPQSHNMSLIHRRGEIYSSHDNG